MGTNNSTTNGFGKKLKELREEAGVSLMQLAKSIDASDAAICKWENGLAEPRISYVIKLASFFGCSTDYLLLRSDEFDFAQKEENEKDAEEREFVKRYKRLPKDKKELLAALINSWN